MHWTIAAPFLNQENIAQTVWLERHVPGCQHQFTLIPRRRPLPSWHERKSKFTGLGEWINYWQHGADALQASRGGVITVFPQLAAAVGCQQQLPRKRQGPVLAWLFNIGTCRAGLPQQLSRVALRQIDRFVVHTQRERYLYSQWLNLPLERFEFVPYQVPPIPITYAEETSRPFITALGTAHRDFPTLFAAIERLKLPTVVASGPRALEGLTIPASVQTPFGLSKADCLKLAQQARINVVPLLPNEKVTAAGQVTIVEAMRMGRALIATRGTGAEDYIVHGETGLLIDPHSPAELATAIEQLWDNEALRVRMGQNAMRYAEAHFSDETAGQALGRLLDSLEQSYRSDGLQSAHLEMVR
jgi:glycosyltransferase involved in cell wall biosynthesis